MMTGVGRLVKEIEGELDWVPPKILGPHRFTFRYDPYHDCTQVIGYTEGHKCLGALKLLTADNFRIIKALKKSGKPCKYYLKRLV